MSILGILRRPVPPSAEAGRGRCGVAYSGRGVGFERVGAGVTFTRSGSVPGRGAAGSMGGGPCFSRARRLRLRSARRAARKVVIDAWCGDSAAVVVAAVVVAADCRTESMR